MKIKPSLFLNMSPQTIEDGSLAFARNMKLDDDGNLISDYGYKNIELEGMAGYHIVGHIVGLDNKIYFFLADDNNQNKIVEYDEIEHTSKIITDNVEEGNGWNYSGGEISGYVTTNISGEKILTIAEYGGDINVPLKHINLSFADVGDESIYCQAPSRPTANLTLKSTYLKVIPNGVYVFFIRYKIRKDVYTNWFLCSRPIFGGTSSKINTIQGGLKYINLHRDSAKSFVFKLDFADETNIDSYEEFQLGFIITHDEATDARAWKHFRVEDFIKNDSEKIIYFDYENVEEANIDDLLETTYELYNVHNVASFKNKLYISNYIESDFNPNLQDLADNITLSLTHSSKSTDKISYQNMEVDFGKGFTKLAYDYGLGYYDGYYKNGSVVKFKDVSPLEKSNIFNYNVYDFVKGETKEYESILTFDIKADYNKNPDLATIYNIANNAFEHQIFGEDYKVFFNYGRLGVVREIGDVFGTYAIFIGDNSDGSSTHPWYDKNLTFIYGSGGEQNPITGTNDCFYFRKDNIYTVKYDGETYKGWPATDLGYQETVKTDITNNIKKEIEGKSRFIECYTEIYEGTKVYKINYETFFEKDTYCGFDTENKYGIDKTDWGVDNATSGPVNDQLKTLIINNVWKFIQKNTIGIDESGMLILDISSFVDNEDGNVIVHASTINTIFKKIEFVIDAVDNIESSDNGFTTRYTVNKKGTDYSTICVFQINENNIINSDNTSNFQQASTLMPLSKYKAYAHFVDEHGIITNGYPVVFEPTELDKEHYLETDVNYNQTDILSLRYRLNLEDYDIGNYKTFFITLQNVGNIVIECFNFRKYNGDYIVDCLESDALLYNINDDIHIVGYDNAGEKQLEVTNAKYYSSGTSNPTLAFGNNGFIKFYGTIPSGYKPEDLTYYVIIERTYDIEKHNNLVKASSYIPLIEKETPVEVPDGFYGSYFCLVKKPSFDLSSICYVSGSDIYNIDRDNGLTLTTFKNYIQTQDSPTYLIRSNYNLNYLSLTEDIEDKIFGIGNASSGIKQVAKVINSSILSFIYELKPMYKDFMNKTFKEYDKNYKTEFDNTIRVSHVLSDETFNNSVFKFAATDYYNVPTDRGIIVNLFNIANNIFVHCKDSLYKFDGNNTIASNNQDIQLQESEPFDVGISQVIDSEHGYGGIHDKRAGCITFDSYFFYDRFTNHIFAYSGNSQIQLIDGNIYKLLDYYKPSDCKTLHDELNCRILFEFTSSRPEHNIDGTLYKTFTISYNYKTKTFVSFHDLSLENAFSSKNKAYSYKENLLNLFDTSSNIDITPLVRINNVYKIFGDATTFSIIQFGASIYKKQATPFGLSIVWIPKENIRETVESVKYIADVKQDTIETQQTLYDVMLFPQTTRTNPVVNFYIITDRCISSLITTTVDDEKRPNSLLDYKGFKYDMGFWTGNYFRNAIDADDIYNYKSSITGHALNSDQNSLVYGRYFIFNFDFKVDTPIKFEEIFVNTQKY